jgi:DNA-binding NarL/FixJ family response regulator
MNKNPAMCQGSTYKSKSFTPNRYLTIIRTSEQAIRIILYHLYPKGSTTEQMTQRNKEIRSLFTEGMTKADIARQFGISERRVRQIIDEENNSIDDLER